MYCLFSSYHAKMTSDQDWKPASSHAHMHGMEWCDGLHAISDRERHVNAPDARFSPEPEWKKAHCEARCSAQF